MCMLPSACQYLQGVLVIVHNSPALLDYHPYVSMQFLYLLQHTGRGTVCLSLADVQQGTGHHAGALCC